MAKIGTSKRKVPVACLAIESDGLGHIFRNAIANPVGLSKEALGIGGPEVAPAAKVGRLKLPVSSHTAPCPRSNPNSSQALALPPSHALRYSVADSAMSRGTPSPSA